MLVTSVSQLSLATGNLLCAVAKASALLHSTVAFNAAVSVVQVGGILSLTVIVCTWSAARFPQLSTKLQVLVIIREPWQAPATLESL